MPRPNFAIVDIRFSTIASHRVAGAGFVVFRLSRNFYATLAQLNLQKRSKC